MRVKPKSLICLMLCFLMVIGSTTSVFAASKTGWVKENGKTYYYQKGAKVKNKTLVIDDVEYKFDKNGVKQDHYIMKVPYINQNYGKYLGGKKYDLKKGYLPYGCAIVSSAMAVSYLNDKFWNPSSVKPGNYTYSGGSGGSGLDAGILVAKANKLSKTRHIRITTKPMTQMSHDSKVEARDKLKKILAMGRPVMVLVNNSIYGGYGDIYGGSKETGGGHYILIIGYSGNKFAVADPNNVSQSYFPAYDSIQKKMYGGKLQSFASFKTLTWGDQNAYWTAFVK